jgi:hypothetical protein
MGNFSASCFASHQTIASGATCYLLPVRQQSSYELLGMTFQGQPHELPAASRTRIRAHPNAYWEPLTGFLEAIYVGGGEFTLCRTQRNYRFLLYLVRATLISATPIVQQGENASRDVPYDILAFMDRETPNLCAALSPDSEPPSFEEQDQYFDELLKVWDYTWEAGWEHRLFAYSSPVGLRPVTFAVLHGEAYRELTQIIAEDTTWDDVSLHLPTYFELLCAEVRKEWTTSETDLGKEGHTNLREAAKDHPGLAQGLRDSWAYLAAQKFFERLHRIANFEGSPATMEHRLLTASLKKYAKGALSSETLFAIVEPFMADRYVMEALESLSLPIMPMVCAPEDGLNEVGDRYALFVSKVNNRVGVTRRQG